jgi:hypothetical protein
VSGPSAKVELSATSQGCTARLILDLGFPGAEAATVAHDLARGMLGQVEVLLADPGADLPAELCASLAALADALTEQITGEATVTALDTPRTRAWRAHPAGQGRR